MLACYYQVRFCLHRLIPHRNPRQLILIQEDSKGKVKLLTVIVLNRKSNKSNWVSVSQLQAVSVSLVSLGANVWFHFIMECWNRRKAKVERSGCAVYWSIDRFGSWQKSKSEDAVRKEDVGAGKRSDELQYEVRSAETQSGGVIVES